MSWEGRRAAMPGRATAEQLTKQAENNRRCGPALADFPTQQQGRHLGAPRRRDIKFQQNKPREAGEYGRSSDGKKSGFERSLEHLKQLKAQRGRSLQFCCA